MRQGPSTTVKGAPPAQPLNKPRPPPPQPYYTSYRRGGAYSQLVHSRSPNRATAPTAPTPPARKAPESSFNENSPAGIAVSALLMAANAMDFSKPKDDGADGPPQTKDSETGSNEKDAETRRETVPNTPEEAKRSGEEGMTTGAKIDPQKTVEVSPDDRFNRKRNLDSVVTESPMKGSPNLQLIKKKARPLPSSKKLERNVSADDADDVQTETLELPNVR